MFVLDTNIVSELRKVRSGKANLGVASWAEQVPSAELFISAITIHELEHGVLLMEGSDPAQGAVLRAWLDQSVAAAFKSRVLPVDERVVRRAAGLHVPDPAPFRDALIGATALVHD
ncbi:MAG TPA: type II toxin-antitoxin system VapC family toxin, partial [Ilumatobacteraceae bacterium]|nr:type II toxin-antitoxin system VapC family toxin [Ilumatobacteraceae bacterium]